MAKGPSKTLTEKQEKFCLKYFETGNGLRSVLDAGYDQTDHAAGVTANRLLKNPLVQARLGQLRQKQEARTEISVDYVINNLKEVVERCMQRAPVMVQKGQQMVQATDADGNHIWRFDANGANGALQMLGKHLKMFTEKHEHSGKITLEDLVAGSSEEE